MKLFHKSSIQQLNIEDADRILAEALKTAGAKPSSISLEELIANGLYRRRKRIFRRIIFAAVIGFLLLAVYLCFLSIPVSFTVQDQMSEGEFNPVYTVSIDSFIPVRLVNASLEGRSVPLYETEPHIYTAEPTCNGRMEVSVTLANGQSARQYVDVTGVDLDSPAAVGCQKEGRLIYLYLSDDLSGIDYDSLQAVTLTGTAVTPVSTDPLTGCIVFPDPEETMNIYVCDLAGNRLHLIVSLQ